MLPTYPDASPAVAHAPSLMTDRSIVIPRGEWASRGGLRDCPLLGTNPKCRNVRYSAAVGVKADVTRRAHFGSL